MSIANMLSSSSAPKGMFGAGIRNLRRKVNDDGGRRFASGDDERRGLASMFARKYKVAPAATAAPAPAPTGFTPDPNNPQKTLAYITDELQKRKNELYWPLEDELIKSLDDTSLIGQSRQEAIAANGVQRGLAARTLQRSGAQLTPMQQRAMEDKLQLGDALRVDNATNNARLDVKERNDAVLGELLNNSRSLTGQAIDGMSGAAALQANRKQAYDSAKAAYHNNKVGALSSVASTGLLFAFL